MQRPHTTHLSKTLPLARRPHANISSRLSETTKFETEGLCTRNDVGHTFHVIASISDGSLVVQRLGRGQSFEGQYWRAMADIMHAVLSIANTRKYDVTSTCVQGRTFDSDTEVAGTLQSLHKHSQTFTNAHTKRYARMRANSHIHPHPTIAEPLRGMS